MDFYQRMKIVCSRIPEGKVATYGQIALLCGKPKNARQVGHALNRGLAGTEIPAHRVVNAKGVLSGAAAFDTPDLQKILLENEEVRVKKIPQGYQVDLKVFGWKNTMKEAMELEDEFRKRNI